MIVQNIIDILEAFAPAGTNVDFIARPTDATDAIPIRTYERGVEAETLACGTGITAAALVAMHLGWTASPATLATPSGYRLRVTASPLTLTGPATTIYTATLDLAPGTYEYKFIVNGFWTMDPDPSREWVPNGLGTLNSVVVVK